MAKVLLATDPGPPHTRGLVRAFLESAGHEVREVSDGTAVLAELHARPPEVLILDTALLALDGFQVLARLRAQPGHVAVPIVVISTIAAQLGSQLAESLGATAYLRKPFTFQTLRETVEEVLTPPAADQAAASPDAAGNGRGPHPLAARARRRGRGTRHRPAG
jgi:DNA-binding response OmpR family regulator